MTGTGAISTPVFWGNRCTCLVCTSKSPSIRVFVYISPEIQSFSPSFEETCTTKRHCGAVLLYKRALYIRPAFSLSEIILIFAVRSAPSRTGHRPGGEMVDTRDLKSLGPKRPCGFDSRPGHRNTLSRYLEGVFSFTWQTFGKHHPQNRGFPVWLFLRQN